MQLAQTVLRHETSDRVIAQVVIAGHVLTVPNKLTARNAPCVTCSPWLKARLKNLVDPTSRHLQRRPQ